MKCFNDFVQSAVNARREGDENAHSSVVAETLNLLAISSYRYQIKDRSWHTLTKHLNDERAHTAIKNMFFIGPSYLNDNCYEVESVRSKVEYKEPLFVGLSHLAVYQTVHA